MSVVSKFLADVKQDWSVSAITSGFIAVLVSYAGPLLIVFQAARIAHLSDAELSSWIWAISFSSGLAGLLLSAWFRAPVIASWSTPGAVLLVSGWAGYSFAESVGAFVFSAVLVVILGYSGLFSAMMERIPRGIIAAMLAGILLKFGVDVFVSLKQMPLVALPMFVVYLLSKRYCPRYAVAATLLSGLASAGLLHELAPVAIGIALVEPVYTAPVFSLKALVGLGLPLCIVTMVSQNATGIGVLKVDGYDLPPNPLIGVTGIASLLSAPFGSHGVNLAAITAAICTGKEAHAQPEKRYVAGIACGVFYMLLSLFGATVVAVFSAFPAELIAVIAGVALFGSLGSSLSSAMETEKDKESALVTFLITISGVSLLGIGAPFWGLIGGMITYGILTGNLRWLWQKLAAVK